jgi:hypothetical protein
MMSSSFDKTACHRRQFANLALDFVHGDQRIAFGHIFIGKHRAGTGRFGGCSGATVESQFGDGLANHIAGDAERLREFAFRR